MSFSISEIMLIVVIAMLVIKPEQLPEAAYTLGQFTKSIRKMFTKVQNEMHHMIDSVETKNDTQHKQP